MRSLCCTLTIACLCLASPLSAEYITPDLEKVPVERLIENLTKAIEANPKDAKLRMNLARLHGMAFAMKLETVEIQKKQPLQVWFGYEPNHVPFANPKTGVRPAEDAKKEELAKQHLEKAIVRFQEAVKFDPKNLTAQLGLAWCLEQAGKKDEAIKGYREVIEAAWPTEKGKKTAGLGWHSVVAEAAGYLKPLLDPNKDEKEIAELNTKIAEASRVSRPITPIAIPLAEGRPLRELLAPEARVRFDVDGTRAGHAWSWISPEAGWLVHDRAGTGKIESGLQLFGNVSFWLFWENGYEALSALDNNGDGRLAGDELAGLAIWRDANSNGVSEPGEVRPLAEHGVVALSCRSERHDEARTVAAWSPAGVEFKDGSKRASYDVILRPAK